MNARNYLYINSYNSRDAKIRADDKLETKKTLIKHGIATPELFASFENRNAIQNFDWSKLPSEGFVIKPSRGYAGAGILPIRSYEDGIARTVTGDELSTDQLKSHCIDVLDGGFSLQYLPDKAFIEERIVPYHLFRKLGAVGIPDIRIIVFHHIPVMAMVRFPTEESAGKANISLGALGFGIDMRTGITTGARSKHGPVITTPGSKVKTRGIKIPNWDDLMLLAARTQSVCGLGFAGIDIVLKKDGSASVLEVNARPGLEIQNINMASLRDRLERIEYMPVPSPERGVEVAKSLFAEQFSEKVSTAPKVITIIQPITLRNGKKSLQLEAKVDTANYRSVVDTRVAQELDLQKTGETVGVQTDEGIIQRDLYHLSLEIAGKKVNTSVILADRGLQRYAVSIGRLNLKRFLIKPVLRGDAPSEELSDLIMHQDA